MDRGSRIGTADRRAAGPAHSPRPHPGDERPPFRRRRPPLQTPSSPTIPNLLPVALVYWFTFTPPLWSAFIPPLTEKRVLSKRMPTFVATSGVRRLGRWIRARDSVNWGWAKFDNRIFSCLKDYLAVAFSGRIEGESERERRSVSEPCANAESKGCKGPATDQGIDLGPAGSQEPRRHYCRGCGQSLSLGSRGQFHKECLRADKRARTRCIRLGRYARFEWGCPRLAEWLAKRRH
jgi:hypothetical protein